MVNLEEPDKNIISLVFPLEKGKYRDGMLNDVNVSPAVFLQSMKWRNGSTAY